MSKRFFYDFLRKSLKYLIHQRFVRFIHSIGNISVPISLIIIMHEKAIRVVLHYYLLVVLRENDTIVYGCLSDNAC